MTQYPYGGENASTLTPNGEQEYYAPFPGAGSPFRDSNGVLDITATPAAPGSNPYGLAYTSGLLTTYKSFAQTYGYFEVRAKLPAGQGLWPAFWMLPADNSCASELDIFEMLGSNPSTIYGTTHGSWYSNGVSRAFSVPDTSAGFHTYGVDWQPGTITFYMDGVKLGASPTPTTMDTPMYMLLDLAVGGAPSWGGAPSASTAFPATMSIDYVRAYATVATAFSGGAAATNAPSSTTAAEAAAAPPGASTGASTGASLALGSGPDTLALAVNEDAWQEDAQFTLSVDGVQVGGVETATASHEAGATQEFDIRGSFAPGAHTVTVDFLNDAYDSSTGLDRNLYVTGAKLNGAALPSSSLSEYVGGPQSFSFQGEDTATASLSQHASNADLQYGTLFDGAYYRASNPDVAASGIDPLTHYEMFGAHEGRNPNPLFDTGYYLATNPDVAASGINPLLHFEVFGTHEGRNPDMLFNTSFYLSHNPDVAAAGADALQHFETFGWHEGRDPDALFDTSYYLAHNPDVAASGMDPLVHYDEFGWHEGRNPSAAFDTDAYLQANADVRAAGMDPLAHYLTFGNAEGRAIYAVPS